MPRALVVVALALLAPPAGAARAPKPPCTPSWTTIDTFLPAGATQANAAKVLATSSGVFVVGSSWTSNLTSSWVVRRSKEGGTWLTVDDYLWSFGVSAHPDAITRDATNLYVVGGANVVGSQAGPWLVRSSANGETWSTVDVVEDPALPSAMAHATTPDPSGALLVGGARFDAESGQYRWLVRRSADGGASWSVDDDVAPTVGAAGVYALAADPASGAAYAAGYDWDGYQYVWKVRRRVGGAWQDAEHFLLTPSPALRLNGSVPAAVAVGRAGAVFVVGTAFDAGGRAHWLVRRSTDGGSGWTTVDDPFGGTQRCGARAITYDAASRTLFVVGRCASGATYRWLVRASNDDGATWRTEDEFTLATDADAWASGVDASPEGQIYAVGAARDARGTLRWVTRARTCP